MPTAPRKTPSAGQPRPSRLPSGSQLVTLGVAVALIAAIVVLAALHDLTPPATGLLGVLVGGHGIVAADSLSTGRNSGG